MKKTTLADQTAASKAMEYMFPPEERLFVDEYSVKFISAFNRSFIGMLQSKRLLHWMVDLSEKIAPGVYGGLIARTRYIDDVIDKALDEGIETIVNLGGGYDTRCLRIGKMKDIDYYHVDQAEVIDNFGKNMMKLPMAIPENIRFVSIDFDKQSIADVLANSGYDKRLKTLFIWEAVTQYISEEAVSETLNYIASAKNGSKIVFTYILKSLLTNPEQFPEYKSLKKQISRMGSAWTCGLDPSQMSEYLDQYGIKLIEDVGKDEFLKRYFLPIGREIELMSVERVALAYVDN